MSLCVVLLSLSAPAFGLTDRDSTNESDIPEFNVSTKAFDITGQFPESPGTPSTGELKWYNESTIGRGISQLWLDGSTSGGTEVFVSNAGTDADPNPEIQVNEWNNGDLVGKDTYTLTDIGDDVRHKNNSYSILFTVDDIKNKSNTSTDESEFVVSYKIVDQSADENWLERIPIVGGLYSAGEALAQIVGWIGGVLYWFLGTTLEVILNLVNMLVESTIYMFSTFHWLMSTYFGIINSAPGWSAVIVTVPGIILFAELAKLVAVAISLLPTT
jgi:hypothetical protein